MLLQHGDVLIKRLSGGIPQNATKRKLDNRGVVLAEGEVTGHAHVIKDSTSAVLFESDFALYLRVLSETTVVHEEHKPITIPAGDYQIGIVREYDHFAEEARKVAD